MIKTDRDLAAFVERHSAAAEIALDTEFHSERTYWPRLALLQLAAEGEVAVVDPLVCDMAELTPLLTGCTTVIMHAASNDIQIVERATDVTIESIYDTQAAAALLGRDSVSLQNLLYEELGVKLTKGSRMTDWLARPLSGAQLAYAASDVEHLVKVAERQRRQLADLGRVGWLEEEFNRIAEGARRPRKAPAEAILKAKGANELRPRSRLIAGALAEWRENRARTLDIPTRFVLSDAAIIALAASGPANEAELKKVRGISSVVTRGANAAAILAAIEDGASKTEAARGSGVSPLRRRTLRDTRGVVALATAWAAEVGRRENIGAAMLATRGELEALINGEPCGRLESGWRRDLLFESVQALAAGDAALQIGERGQLTLIAVGDAVAHNT